MKREWPHGLEWIALISVIAVIVGVLIWTGTDWSKPEHHVYRIGWEPDPPFQAVNLEGQATGLAVELVREAAKRRGIRLEWVRQPRGADAALRDRVVDLWPLISIIPERKRYIHFTEPYLEAEHCFLVRADSTYVEIHDLESALVSHNGTQINERNLRILLPNARLLSSRGTEAAMENVCQHRAEAVFVEEYTAISALLGGLSCSGQELRLIPAPDVRSRLGVGSTFAASPVADAIQQEIGKIAGEGKLPTTLLRWNYFSRRNLESIQALREAKRLERLLTGLVGGLLGVLSIAGWLTVRTLREGRKARVAEKELSVSQQNYRLLTEQAADGVFLVDKDGRFLVVNSRLCEMLGYTEEEMAQLNLLDTYLSHECECGRQRFAAFPCGTSTRFERLMRRKDGTSISVEASVVRLKDGRTQEIVRDITERKQAESTLKESEERFRNMADTAPVMIWVTGPDKRAIFVNKCWLDFTGSTTEKTMGDGWVAGLHPEDRENFLGVFSSSIDARREFRSVFRLWRSDGEYRWVLCTGVPRFVPEGVFGGYIGSCIDVTDVKRAEGAALAQQKLESLGVLANGIAHDFNNLLGSILASTELALSERADGSPIEDELLRIRIASIRGAEVVRELMIYGGNESPALEPLDISALVAEMLELLKVSISKHAILEDELGTDLPTVRANAAQIRQAVMNLVINASEAIGEQDGKIRVTTARVRVEAGSSVYDAANLPEGDYMRLEVSDTGVGITPEVQARMFDPFFTTKEGGHGLGLAAVQGIIRSHGGTLNVASASGQGSHFEVLLPCIKERPLDRKETVVPASNRKPGSAVGTALVVEDEEILRMAVSKMLRKKGFSVIEASDGSTAARLFLANEREIDVVLLDVSLPGMSGRDVVAEFRRIRPNVKVILTSAFSEDKAFSLIGGPHSWRFIRKPYQFSELTNLLQQACLDDGSGAAESMSTEPAPR